MSASVNLHAHKTDRLEVDCHIRHYGDGVPYLELDMTNRVDSKLGGMVDWIAGLCGTPGQLADVRNAIDMALTELAGIEPEDELVRARRDHDAAVAAADAEGYEGPSFGEGR